MSPDGWTEADQAELDTILWVFVGAYRAHEFCGDCQRIRRRVGYGMCQTLATAWDAVEAWLRVRRLLSRAQHLRACQRILEDVKRYDQHTEGRGQGGAARTRPGQEEASQAS